MHEILRWAASIGTIGASLILAARGSGRVSLAGLLSCYRSIHNPDRHRLSNRRICAHGAKRSGDVDQPVRHLSMANLGGAPASFGVSVRLVAASSIREAVIRTKRHVRKVS
jgi:hypothetical protein